MNKDKTEQFFMFSREDDGPINHTVNGAADYLLADIIGKDNHLIVKGECENVIIDHCRFDNFRVDLTELKFNSLSLTNTTFLNSGMININLNRPFSFHGANNTILGAELEPLIPSGLEHAENDITVDKIMEETEKACYAIVYTKDPSSNEQIEWFIFSEEEYNNSIQIGDGGFHTLVDEDEHEYIIHSEVGPAIRLIERKIDLYFKEGRLHRDGGPAVVHHENSDAEWFINGFHHRIDGPAIMMAGHETYAVCGQELTQEQFLETIADRTFTYADSEITVRDAKSLLIDSPYTPAVLYTNGDQLWARNGTAHRTDGPAEISEGNEYWFNQGVLHRDNGPAIVLSNGTHKYYIYGKLHCTDGPAVSGFGSSGDFFTQYYINDRLLSKDEWQKETGHINEFVKTFDSSSAPNTLTDDTIDYAKSGQPKEAEKSDNNWVLSGLALAAAGLLGAISSKNSANLISTDKSAVPENSHVELTK